MVKMMSNAQNKVCQQANLVVATFQLKSLLDDLATVTGVNTCITRYNAVRIRKILLRKDCCGTWEISAGKCLLRKHEDQNSELQLPPVSGVNVLILAPERQRDWGIP